MWRGPAWVTVVRDLACLVLPGTAFIIEALKDKPSVELLVIYMALVSMPGLAGAVALARHGPGTGPPSSPPPPLPPSSPSSSSSTTAP
ncbi:hypothetical protein [Actinomadura sediminis]|uniref:Uncharacterized protein n=1 Tax=Actinomadura sediminis TaxID=1038904 RepID=A0ABW3EQ77_9ACTN